MCAARKEHDEVEKRLVQAERQCERTMKSTQIGAVLFEGDFTREKTDKRPNRTRQASEDGTPDGSKRYLINKSPKGSTVGGGRTGFSPG